jgi:hypothetical protein
MILVPAVVCAIDGELVAEQQAIEKNRGQGE